MQHLSLLTAGWSYIPAGLTFGYLLMLPLNVPFVHIYNETMFWPFIVTIIALLISVAITNGLKLNFRKCQFVHLYVMFAGALLFLASGLMFLLLKDVVPAIYLGACGLGLTLIPGLSLCHIRAPGRWRPLYMGLCYFWFLAGLAATSTIFLHNISIEITITETVHTDYSICVMTAAIFTILLVAINEMLQREGIVDYKKPLDFDTDIAHESGKLMGQGEGRNLYNNFTTTSVPANGTGANQWTSSTEHIIMGGVGSRKNYHKLWVFYMIFTKLQGFIAFYWIFVYHAVLLVSENLFGTLYGYAVFWFMTAGALLGCLAMIVLSTKIVYMVASLLHTVGLILAISFYSADIESRFKIMAISLLVFYTFIGASLVIPAINILELSPLNFNESFLAVGSIVELIGIALMQYFAMKDKTLLGVGENGDEVVSAHYISMIVLSVLLQVIVLWHMPNTFKKSLAEIKSDLNRMTSYFAFSRMMVPVTQHTATARTFAESVTSEQPEQEENRLSTRNGHLATRYNERSDDSTGDRHSPYNDFSETRHNRRTMVDRAQSPVVEGREDPFLQEQLQRQHERNYIHSRQQHYQYQARESPESQQYSYRPERQLDYRQSRYLPEPEDYPQERAIDSQPIRYNPPLLSRHQYYEEYSQERQQKPPTPQPKPLPTRQPSMTPSDSQSPAPSLIRRSANPSATVKSEPGYVSRPRLLAQKSEAPAPPPLPPADYLTKSLPRIKPDRQQSRESIHPVLIPKPPKPEEDIVPGVEYSSNLRPSEFLRQTRQSEMFRKSQALT